ncbi:MAG: mycofactocin system FadH/OYE family oxidoreductase 1 [Microthrixaceae bacterium]
MPEEFGGLLDPFRIGRLTAPNRIVFGPHETNLGRGRTISDRHVAYYARRASGGAGVIVTEEASVHDSDWPYERAPLASECAAGWAEVAQACHEYGSLVFAALGHAGGQGTSHWSQRELWAPGPVPEVNTREVPKVMEDDDIEAVIAGFAEAAATAVAAGCDGVEINAGQFSLARQFLSALTNTRGDQWGEDRTLFLDGVLSAVRDAVGDAAVALRLSCDELAPWAGITPEQAPELAVDLLGDPAGPAYDMLTVVKGSIFSAGATRPDGHAEAGFNIELANAVAAALGEVSDVPVVVQGSIVDPSQAESVVGDGPVAAVEMTRAHIADPLLVSKLEAGESERVRPCVLCNQMCAVRDNRNPIVSCTVEPFSGHETEDTPVEGKALSPLDVLVVGAGPAGLEAARVAALRGHRVKVAERSKNVGGSLAATAAQPGRSRFSAFGEWQEAECRRLGVEVATGTDVDPDDAAEASHVIVAVGGRPAEITAGSVADAALVIPAAAVLITPPAGDLPDGAVLVWDPIGGPTGVAVAELLAAAGREVHIATQDYIVGNELARAGDLGPANARLAQAGVHMHRRKTLAEVANGRAVLRDRFGGEDVSVEAVAVVDAGARLPNGELEAQLAGRLGHRIAAAGDCVAPRTVYEAVLEGRRRALELG